MGNFLQNSPDLDILVQEAIKAAASLDWHKAVKINRKILNLVKDDVETLNRLAHAQICLGNKEKAQKLYKKALELDSFNIIAKKNLDKLTKSNDSTSDLGNGPDSSTNNAGSINLGSLFLYEPGKTKIVNLLNLASPAVLATLSCGNQVLINPKSHSVTITTFKNVYLGALPDDLAHRLIDFINGGNQYDAFIKNATVKLLSVFIREVYRSPKFASQPSFQSKQPYWDEAEVIYF